MRSLTLAAVLLAITGAAVAQPPTFVISGVSDPTAGLYGRLAASKVLSDELKLTDDQKAKLKAALEPIQKAEREAGKLPRPKSIDERRERDEQSIKRQADRKAAAGAVLTPEQVKRVNQIAYQDAGWSAFGFPTVRDELKLTDGQRERLDMTLIGHMERQQALLAPPGERPTPEQMRKLRAERDEKLAVLGKETLGKIEAALTAEQKAAWKAMLGPKFDLNKLRDETAWPKPKDK